MLVVVALLAMASGLIFADFRPALTRYRLETARSDAASAVVFTRARALRTGQPQTLAVAADGSALLAAGRRQALPPGVRIDPAAAVVTFSPDGTSEDGQRLVLSNGRGRLALDVEAGSGLVTVARGGG